MKKDIWLIDGYNVIFADEEYWEFHKDDIAHSRERLQSALLDLAGHRNIEMWLVFDGRGSVYGAEEIKILPDFTVVYTGIKVTADSYIEKTAYRLKDGYRNVFVVTSDGPEQSQILGSGAYRKSTRELLEEIQEDKRIQSEERNSNELGSRLTVSERLDKKSVHQLEKFRRGK